MNEMVIYQTTWSNQTLDRSAYLRQSHNLAKWCLQGKGIRNRSAGRNFRYDQLIHGKSFTVPRGTVCPYRGNKRSVELLGNYRIHPEEAVRRKLRHLV